MKKTRLFRWVLLIVMSVAFIGNTMCIQAAELLESEIVVEETESLTAEAEETDTIANDTEEAVDSVTEAVRLEVTDYSVPTLSYEEFKDSIANGTATHSGVAVPENGKNFIDEIAGNTYLSDDFDLNYELSVAVSSASGERTIPEPNLQIFVDNVDSLKNGSATTQTVLVWQFDDSDLDGDTIEERWIEGFPEGYILGVLRASDNTPVGFVTQFSNPGTYTVDYYVMDSSEEFNGIRYTLDVLTVGDYSVNSGALSSAEDIDTYTVPIDFSAMSTAAIAFVQSGETNLLVTITDESGEEVKRMSSTDAIARRWCFIDKPANVDRVYNYTVTVAVSNNDYHENSSEYRLMAGSKSDMEEMISYVDNAVLLGKYTASDDTYDFRTGYTPSGFESFYKFTADGVTTVTAMTNHVETRFRILEASTMTEVYDSEDDESAHRTEYTSPFTNIEKQRLGLVSGVEYYLVLYANDSISPIFVEDNITLTQGMGVLKSGKDVFEANSSITAGTSGYSSSATISIQDGVPETAEVKSVDFVSSNGVGLSDIKSFRVKAQYGLTSWQNSVQYRMTINYPYTADGNNNTPLIGDWLYGFQAALESQTMTPQITINYEYEYGD